MTAGKKQKSVIEHYIDDKGRVWRVLREGGRLALLAREIRKHIVGINRRQVEERGGESIDTQHGLAYTPDSLMLWAGAHGRAAEKKSELLEVLEVMLEHLEHKGGDDESGDEGFKTIDWQSFVYDEGGVKGISLRALVEAGLYARMDAALRTLKSSGLDYEHVELAAPQNGGTARQDAILTLRDAQRFAAKARTEVGEQILDTILDHHDDFQKLLAGDEETWERTERHSQREERDPNAEFRDMIMTSMTAFNAQLASVGAVFGQISGAVSQIEQRVTAAEQALQTKRPTEIECYEFAEQLGMTSDSDRPHSQAIGALLREAGGINAGYLRQGVRMVEGKEEPVPAFYVTARAVDDLLDITQKVDDAAVTCAKTRKLISQYSTDARTFLVILDKQAHRARCAARKASAS